MEIRELLLVSEAPTLEGAVKSLSEPEDDVTTWCGHAHPDVSYASL